MLRLYQSNRFELLSKRLADLMAEPGCSPLQPETLVVQHPGMARWLALEIAEYTGICANIRFPLPAAFIWDVFSTFLPDTPLNNRFDPALLSWRIFQLFDQLKNESLFKTLQDYLQTGDEIRGFQLAERLAGLFDRYLVYRPDWIVKWETGASAIQGDDWQAELWRRLASAQEIHWVKLQQQLFSYQGDSPVGLPERVFLIGLPTLSPGYLRIIQWLSQWSEIHLFLLNPCEAYWTEIVDLQEQTRRELMANGQELYLEVGNPLLASLGRQGRDFFAAINEFDPGSEEWFADPGDQTLLQQLQRQILRLEVADSPSTEVDNSVSFHVCHSPMREVEALYDQLLAMLEENPALTPADILVMTPDISTYAPLIEAVFSMPGDRPEIPYRVSDLPMNQDNRYASAFLELLEMPGSRYSVNRMLALLEIPAIGKRFGIDENALEQITDWIEAANIRWGRDGESKTALGLPQEPRNTWRAGLEQLLLGFAMPADSTQLWQGIIPLNAAEGSTASWLGGLVSFCEAVFSLEQKLSGSHNMADWCERLLSLTEVFFADDLSAEQPLQQVRGAIQQLQDSSEAAEYSAEISLPLIRHCLEQSFDRSVSKGFLAGGVNICALAPMRSLPFQVICLIGMNDGCFPREQPILSFDLMSRQFRFGDRSRRADDRYLFLETLISVRQRLYVSYVGRSIKDNSVLPPSVLVDELRDYLLGQIGEQGLEQITQMHPLQPFSSGYFTPEDRLFSYSPRIREAAQLAGHGQKQNNPLVPAALPQWEEDFQRVGLQQLIDFYTNPARVFARQRLNLQLESGSALLDEREPFALERFSGSELEAELVHALLAGQTADEYFMRLDARGVLPHGNPGKRLFEQLHTSAERMADRLQALELDEPLPLMDFTLTCGEMSLDGRLRGLYPQGQFSFSVGKFYPHQLLALWVRHLVVSMLRPAAVAPLSFWLEGEGEGRFRPVHEPERWLGQLLEFYRQGMDKPLRFYPGTSWSYAEAYLRKGDLLVAYNAAMNKWAGNNWYSGDQDKPYHRLLFSAVEMLDESFASTSLAVFRPLFEHMESE